MILCQEVGTGDGERRLVTRTCGALGARRNTKRHDSFGGDTALATLYGSHLERINSRTYELPRACTRVRTRVPSFHSSRGLHGNYARQMNTRGRAENKSPTEENLRTAKIDHRNTKPLQPDAPGRQTHRIRVFTCRREACVEEGGVWVLLGRSFLVCAKTFQTRR